MAEIGINNLTGLALDETFLKKTARAVIKGELSRRLEKRFILSIALVKPDEIKALNKKYRKKNRGTDVLSFFYGASGEVVICPKAVLANAKRFKSAFKKELALVLIHSVLHLLGYDHEKSKTESRNGGTKVKMRTKEQHYLSLLKP